MVIFGARSTKMLMLLFIPLLLFQPIMASGTGYTYSVGSNDYSYKISQEKISEYSISFVGDTPEGVFQVAPIFIIILVYKNPVGTGDCRISSIDTLLDLINSETYSYQIWDQSLAISFSSLFSDTYFSTNSYFDEYNPFGKSSYVYNDKGDYLCFHLQLKVVVNGLYMNFAYDYNPIIILQVYKNEIETGVLNEGVDVGESFGDGLPIDYVPILLGFAIIVIFRKRNRSIEMIPKIY